LCSSNVEPAVSGDASEIAAAHVAAFPGFFLTTLGDRFLTRLYTGFMVHPDGICLVIRDGQRIDGFIAGTSNPQLFFRNLLLRNAVGLVAAAIPPLWRRPLAVGDRLLRAIVYRGEVPPRYPNAALISSIAVRPELSGSGAAGRLIDEFCKRAHLRACRQVYLLTDCDENTAANRFYEKKGFEVESVIVREGSRRMNRLVLDLTPDVPDQIAPRTLST
jgi:ribosomal protein S18 acetylase RimI-like enzyme